MFRLTSMSTGKRNTDLSRLECTLAYSAEHLLPLSASYILFSRGMKFENVQILTDAISDIVTDMKWAW